MKIQIELQWAEVNDACSELVRIKNTEEMSATEFSVAELKEKLKTLGLDTAGIEAELLHRLMEADPSGGWMKDKGATVQAEDSAVEGGGNPAMSEAVRLLFCRAPAM